MNKICTTITWNHVKDKLPPNCDCILIYGKLTDDKDAEVHKGFYNAQNKRCQWYSVESYMDGFDGNVEYYEIYEVLLWAELPTITNEMLSNGSINNDPELRDRALGRIDAMEDRGSF